jgi:hypothetical protein
MHRFRERAWSLGSLRVASQVATSGELIALVGTDIPRRSRDRGDLVSRTHARRYEWSSVTFMRDSRSRGDKPETELAALVPALEAIAQAPPARRPADLDVSVVVHLSVYTNAATISPALLALLHAAGAELEFWTDQEGRDRRRNRGGGY